MVGRPLTEAELVERAKRGDQDAYGDLVHAYQGIAFRTAYLLTGSAAEAEDAAQDAFVKAYYALGRFRTRRGASPLAPADRRQRGSEQPPLGRPAHAPRAARRGGPALGGRGPVPRGQPHRERAAGALLAAVNALPDEQREVVACRYFLELCEEETAETLGLRKGTVKSRLSRGLDRLREELGDD